jgi:hypothetical protein
MVWVVNDNIIASETWGLNSASILLEKLLIFIFKPKYKNRTTSPATSYNSFATFTLIVLPFQFYIHISTWLDFPTNYVSNLMQRLWLFHSPFWPSAWPFYERQVHIKTCNLKWCKVTVTQILHFIFLPWIHLNFKENIEETNFPSIHDFSQLPRPVEKNYLKDCKF